MNMTAKAKAWELWNYYGDLLKRYDLAAECAIKAAEQALESLRMDDEYHDDCHSANSPVCMFWVRVIEELHGLKPNHRP
jgi:hypothetical protein